MPIKVLICRWMCYVRYWSCRMFVRDALSGTSGIFRGTLILILARISFNIIFWLRIWMFWWCYCTTKELIVWKNYDPVPEYIKECMYEKDNFFQHEKNHKSMLTQFQMWHHNNLMLPNRIIISLSSRKNTFGGIRRSIKSMLTQF